MTETNKKRNLISHCIYRTLGTRVPQLTKHCFEKINFKTSQLSMLIKAYYFYINLLCEILTKRWKIRLCQFSDINPNIKTTMFCFVSIFHFMRYKTKLGSVVSFKNLI